MSGGSAGIGSGASGGTSASGGAVSSGGRGGSGVTITPIDEDCGDGLWDEGEGCDDGNRKNGDCCNEFCKVEADCGCPEPPVVGPCRTLLYCGDGVVSVPESCDDGNGLEGDGCAADCSAVTSGWQCRVPGKACAPACGDGKVLGAETCDDGGRVSGDGCSASCQREPGWSCTGEPSACLQSICGNGVLEPGELCDLGEANGVSPGDGSGCTLTCTPEPSCLGNACTTTCGDGNVDLSAGEECDDGNRFSGDGCSETCEVEPGFTCENDGRPDLTIGTLCFPRCGDEVVTVSEECDDGDAESDTDGVLNEDGAYGGCDTQCRLGPYCGDGVVSLAVDPRTSAPYEWCDEGIENTGVYGDVGRCSPSCRVPSACGDGIIDTAFGEDCDNGQQNGLGACSSRCQLRVE